MEKVLVMKNPEGFPGAEGRMALYVYLQLMMPVNEMMYPPSLLSYLLIFLILRCSHPSPAGIELEICRIFFCVGRCF